MMKPELQSVWQYIGPRVEGCPHGQLHVVVYSKAVEVITAGMPYGLGGGWLGSSELFNEHFKHYGKLTPGGDLVA